MDLKLEQRKQMILKAIVESYISAGEPVGSKSLLLEMGLDVSPATVRNDMAALTQNGFLYQPHTSAGRFPSQKALRYYIDNLMEIKLPTERVRDHIDSRLLASSDTPEQLLKTASDVVSEITGCVAVTTTPPANDSRIHRIHFIGTGRHTAMAVLVTTTGMVRSKLFRTSFVVTSEILSILKDVLNKALSGIPLRELNLPFMQTVASSFGDLMLLTPQALSAIMDIARQAQITELCISGEKNLLYSYETEPYTVRGILSFLSDTRKVSELLLSQKSGLSIRIGTECKDPDLKLCTVITSRYEIQGESAGAVALLGPGRMDYAVASGVVTYVSKAVSNALDDMVDI